MSCPRCPRLGSGCPRYPPGTEFFNVDNGLGGVFEFVPGVPGDLRSPPGAKPRRELRGIGFFGPGCGACTACKASGSPPQGTECGKVPNTGCQSCRVGTAYKLGSTRPVTQWPGHRPTPPRATPRLRYSRGLSMARANWAALHRKVTAAPQGVISAGCCAWCPHTARLRPPQPTAWRPPPPPPRWVPSGPICQAGNSSHFTAPARRFSKWLTHG